MKYVAAPPGSRTWDSPNSTVGTEAIAANTAYRTQPTTRPCFASTAATSDTLAPVSEKTSGSSIPGRPDSSMTTTGIAPRMPRNVLYEAPLKRADVAWTSMARLAMASLFDGSKGFSMIGAAGLDDITDFLRGLRREILTPGVSTAETCEVP